MFGKYKKLAKRQPAVKESDDHQNEYDDQISSDYEQQVIEEEEEPSLSDNSVSTLPNNYKYPDISTAKSSNNYVIQPQFNEFLNPSELSILKAEIQNRYDIEPNILLPLIVEYSLGAISDHADIECKAIHNNIEELTALTEEITQKAKECNHLVSKLNDYTVKVSNELKITQRSIQQIKIPRRSLLQLIMLLLVWIINIFIGIYRKIKSRNHPNNSF